MFFSDPPRRFSPLFPLGRTRLFNAPLPHSLSPLPLFLSSPPPPQHNRPHLAQVALRLAGQLAHDLGPVDDDEKGARLVGHRARDQRLAAARGAVQEDAFRGLDADGLEEDCLGFVLFCLFVWRMGWWFWWWCLWGVGHVVRKRIVLVCRRRRKKTASKDGGAEERKQTRTNTKLTGVPQRQLDQLADLRHLLAHAADVVVAQVVELLLVLALLVLCF